jgi:hypothetical protein
MNGEFLQERITKTKELIVAYEDAIAALAGGAQSWMLDTGQTKQSVTNFDLEKLNAMLDSLYNRCATMEARYSGAGQITVRPSF